MQTVAQQLGKRQLDTFEMTPRLVSNDAIGIELELEGFTEEARVSAIRALGHLWNVERDGSLRNGGVEFITNGGLGGAVLYNAIDTLTNFLRDTPHDVTFRCSTHMHINMLDFTVPQVVKFILVYTAVEPYLFSLAGAYRYSSNFCTPVAESVPFHKRILSQMTASAVRHGGPLRHCNKYTALNISPLFHDPRSGRSMGTIEYRGGRAMVTADELFQQCNILLSIKKFVREFDGDEEAMLNSLAGGVIGTVTEEILMAGLNVSEDTRERALMNAWSLLKAYQQAQVVSQTTGVFPEDFNMLGSMDILQQLGITRDNWGAFFENFDYIRHESPRSSLRRASSIFRTSRTQVARSGLFHALADVTTGSATRMALIQALYNLRHLASDDFADPPATPTNAVEFTHPIVDIHEVNPEEVIYNFSLSGDKAYALSTYITGQPNMTTRAILDWLMTSTVRLKNRDRINAGLRDLGISYQVGEREQAATMSRIFKTLLLPFEDHVWRADRTVYIRVLHVVDFLTANQLRVPLISERGGFAFSRHLLREAMTPVGTNESDAYFAGRVAVRNEISVLLGASRSFRLI